MRFVTVRFALKAAFAATVLCLNGHPVDAFTQAGGTLLWKFPSGHEYITVRAAKMALEDAHKILQKTPGSDRASLILNQLKDNTLQGEIPNDLNFDSPYHNVWAAVMGQRFVDLGGFSLVASGSRKCWDAITQMQEEGQADHFLRRHNREDEGAAGGRNAIERGKRRFREVFLEAVAADDHLIEFHDGGGTSSAYKANKSYFLFGRAVHLLQDSFSPEHVRRNKDFDYFTIMDIKTYMCTLHSGQHTKKKPWDDPEHGDVIWIKNATNQHSLENLRPEARQAVNATASLWEIFAVSHADRKNPKVAEENIDAFINIWMKIDQDAPLQESIADAAAAQKSCEQTLGWPASSYDNLRACLEEIKPTQLISRKPADRPVSDYVDFHMLLPYHWEWTKTKALSVLQQVPAINEELLRREKGRPSGAAQPDPSIAQQPEGREKPDPIAPQNETFSDTNGWPTAQGNKAPDVKKAQAEEQAALKQDLATAGKPGAKK